MEQGRSRGRMVGAIPLLALLFGGLLSTLTFNAPAFAQHISIALKGHPGVLMHVDSTNWTDAWIEISGMAPGLPHLTEKDFTVREEGRTARILAVDSLGLTMRSHLALSIVLDNSSSMFHAYDSLTR